VTIRPRPIVVEVAAVGAVALYNVVSHRHVGRRARLATNIGAAAVLVGLARAAGLGAAELGLEPVDLRRGIRTGTMAAVPIVAGVAAAVAVPTTRTLLADEKIMGTGRAEAAFETLVRIPLETALAEEIIFRGVLLGLALRSRTALGAVASSSIWFGLWHVYPTLGSLGRGTGGGLVGERPHRVGGATAAVVVSTAAAGAVFAGLRLRSGSLAAPVIAHAALNMAAFAGVRLTRPR
jgi:membrane protease YdiL (CAAX protease family)